MGVGAYISPGAYTVPALACCLRLRLIFLSCSFSRSSSSLRCRAEKPAQIKAVIGYDYDQQAMRLKIDGACQNAGSVPDAEGRWREDRGNVTMCRGKLC